MRDPEIVRQEMALKDQVIMDCAYELFLEKKIEAVTMDEIIKKSGYGKATIFRHYKNKYLLATDLLKREWKKVLDELDANRPISSIESIPAIDRFTFTLDFYIDMYRNHKDLVKLNDNYNRFIAHAPEAQEIDLPEVSNVAFASADERFHKMYEKAKEDKTLRTDISEDVFFRATLHPMMAACSHYAGGFVWGAAETDNYEAELLYLKEMIIDFATKGL